MKVAFVYDPGCIDGTRGGAELTMDALAKQAPESVTVCEVPEADTVVIGNCGHTAPKIIEQLLDRRVWRFHHDLSRIEHPDLHAWLDENAEHIFTSPLHRDTYGRGGHVIPPTPDLEAFRPNRQVRRHGKREGICSVASWQGVGKGAHLITETAFRHGAEVDVYGTGAFQPYGDNINVKGAVEHSKLPQVLWSYEQFIFLPTAVEPFGRCVAEAWAAGCEILTNDNVGAKWWIENHPDDLFTAADQFWGLLCQTST